MIEGTAVTQQLDSYRLSLAKELARHEPREGADRRVRRRPAPVLRRRRRDRLGLDARSSTFDSTNWESGIVVKVRAVNDFVPQDPQTSVLTHTIVDDAVRQPATRATTRRASSCSRSTRYDDDTPNVVVAETGGSTLLLNNGQPCTRRLEAVRRLHDPPHRSSRPATSRSRSSATGRPTSSRSTASRSRPPQYAVIGGIRHVDAVHGQRRHDGDDDHPRRRLRARQLRRATASSRGQLIQVQGFTATYKVLTVADTSMTVAARRRRHAVRDAVR